MTPSDAVELLAQAITTRGGSGPSWARAREHSLERSPVLGPAGRIYAVDRDAHAVTALKQWAPTRRAKSLR